MRCTTPVVFAASLLCALPQVAMGNYYVPMGRGCTQRLHRQAARRVKHSAHISALRIYEACVTHGGDGRSYLLLGLHQQRLGRVVASRGERDAFYAQARKVFSDGLICNPHDTNLLRAWGLLESKVGNMHRAVLLLRRAAQLDREAVIRILSWRIFRDYLRKHNTLARPHARKRLQASSSLADGDANA